MSVGSRCVRQVDLVAPEESVQKAAARMRDRAVGSLVVTREGGSPVGMITDRDIAVRVVAAGLDPLATVVKQVMTNDPRCVHEETSIEEALGVMRSGPYRRLPVVTEGGLLVGVLSLDDVMDLLAQEFRDIKGLLKRESPVGLASN